MTIFDMLGQSGILTLIGMGIVFGFLIVMVAVVSLMGKIFRSASKDTQPAGGVVNAGNSSPRSGDGAVTAAIGAAVNEYRAKNG